MLILQKTMVTAALSVALAAAAAAQTAGQPSKSVSSLTALDYLEIRELVARYAYAVDTGAENGAVYASLFAPDGAFLDRNGRATTGAENLAALARRNTRGRQSAFHFMMNHVIEPSAEGATGREYLVQLRMGESGRPNEIFGGGHYEDEYVKTPAGWRFKKRQFFPSERPEPARSPAQ
jgi:hypothetical protein